MSNKVLASFESEDRMQCVDFFLRTDGTFGFEQYRGEHDGSHRWQSLNKYSRLSFKSGEEALQAARQRVAWLSPFEVWRW